MLRIWGRVYNPDGTWTWQAVETTPDGNNDNVYITNLIQVLKLNLNESPFYATYGIPAYDSVVTQVFPDYYVTLTQNKFSGYFASLIVNKVTDPTPTYNIRLTTNAGAVVTTQIPV